MLRVWTDQVFEGGFTGANSFHGREDTSTDYFLPRPYVLVCPSLALNGFKVSVGVALSR